MHRGMELRKAPTASLDRIAEILDYESAWKIVMAAIPKRLTPHRTGLVEPRYNSDNMRSIERHAQENNVKCAKVLFDEWSTTGRERPTLHSLMKVLVEAEMFRAADELAMQMNEPPPQRPLNGPAARICTDVQTLLEAYTNSELYASTMELTASRDGMNGTGTGGPQCNGVTRAAGSGDPENLDPVPVDGGESREEQELLDSVTPSNGPNFGDLSPHMTNMIPNRVNGNGQPNQNPPMPSLENMPRFSMLNPAGYGTDSVSDQPEGSALVSESNPSASGAVEGSSERDDSESL